MPGIDSDHVLDVFDVLNLRDRLFGPVRIPEEAESLAEPSQRAGCLGKRRPLHLRHASRFRHAVDRFREIEQVALGFRRIEVVLHGFLEELLRLARLREHLRVRGELRGSPRRRRVRSAVPRFLPCLEGRFEARVRDPGLAQAVLVPLDRAPVLGRLQVEADHLRLDLLRHVLDQEEVLLRFRHLGAAQEHEPVLDPVAREGLSGRRLGLRDLVLVMREDQVLPPSVEIEGLAEVLHRHRGALDVPSRAPRTPRARPGGLAGLGAFPEREIERVALHLSHLDPHPLAQVVHLAPRELAVLRIAPHVEIDVDPRDVGVLLLDEALDQRDDLGQVLGRPRIVGRALDVQEIGIGEEGLHVPLGHLVERNALLVGALDDPVVDVGEVGDVDDLEALRFEVAPDHVPRHGVAHVPHVRLVLHGHAAHVHSGALGIDRLERELLPLSRVVDADAHAGPVAPGAGRTEIPSSRSR